MLPIMKSKIPIREAAMITRGQASSVGDSRIVPQLLIYKAVSKLIQRDTCCLGHPIYGRKGNEEEGSFRSRDGFPMPSVPPVIKAVYRVDRRRSPVCFPSGLSSCDL